MRHMFRRRFHNKGFALDIPAGYGSQESGVRIGPARQAQWEQNSRYDLCNGKTEEPPQSSFRPLKFFKPQR
jgi:hypothetical protein